MRYKDLRFPALFLLGSLLLTAMVAIYIHRVTEARDQSRFHSRVRATEEGIENRLETHIAMLQGAEFRAYVERLDLRSRYPGIQGIGLCRRVDRAGLPAFLEKLRRDLGPESASLHVRPEGERPWYHIISYLEPMDRRNREALGYDMFTEPVRREAMERARDTGQPAASGKVTLVQEIDEQKQAGFLIYVPIYKNGHGGQAGSVPADLAARRERLLGFVYAPFRADDLLTGIFGHDAHPHLSFQLYNGPTPDRAALLHRSNTEGDDPRYRPRFTTQRTLQVAGRTFSLSFATRPAFEEDSGHPIVPYVVLVGILVGAALFLATWAQARAYREAREAIQVRDEFLSIASHELRTPLTTLQLRTEGLLRAAGRAEALPVTELRPKLEATHRQVLRLAQLVSMLLDVSRISAGRLELEREPVDLGVLCRDVIDRLEQDAARAGSPITLQIEGGGAVVGKWDRVRLDQVLTNLLTNAIKYGGGKPITVRVRHAPGGRAEIEVEDQGIGIDPRDQARLFGRFERLVSSRNFGGFGLGLWISRRIIEAHDGSIAVHSAPGQGACFKVSLSTQPA
jgi:signal transduction histidine kinase